MSLDVYLYGESYTVDCECSCGHVHTKQIRDCFFEGNITHNLVPMAKAAGIYQHLWCPEDIGITKASQLIDALRDACDRMESDRTKYEQFNPENGWGSYDGFIRFLVKYYTACKQNPEANVEVSR